MTRLFMSQAAEKTAMTATQGEVARVVSHRRSSSDVGMTRSLEAQRAQVLAYIESLPDWQVEFQFADQTAGALADRPTFTKTMAAVRAALANVLRF
jgi:hypothetical protein